MSEKAFPQFVRTLIEEQVGRIKKPCCRVAFVYGALRFARKEQPSELVTALYRGKTKTQVDALLAADTALPEICRCSHCIAYLLCGVYDACGRVSIPDEEALGTLSRSRQGFHLEWLVGTTERAELLLALLASQEGMELPLRSERKREGVLLYYKRSLLIEELFYRMEINRAGYRISDLRMQREINNDVNRRMNFDGVNIRKTIASAGIQTEAVAYLEEHNLLSGLPESLQETARLRLSYPAASLQELIELHSEPLTRSGVNHRLSKLVTAANAHKQRQQKKES